jgi:hypothetical protein
VWEQDRRFYAIVTFTDGARVAGGWADKSWASGFPNDEDVYFEVVYSVTDEGRLGDLIPYTAGLLGPCASLSGTVVVIEGYRCLSGRPDPVPLGAQSRLG